MNEKVFEIEFISPRAIHLPSNEFDSLIPVPVRPVPFRRPAGERCQRWPGGFCLKNGSRGWVVSPYHCWHSSWTSPGGTFSVWCRGVFLFVNSANVLFLDAPTTHLLLPLATSSTFTRWVLGSGMLLDRSLCSVAVCGTIHRRLGTTGSSNSNPLCVASLMKSTICSDFVYSLI